MIPPPVDPALLREHAFADTGSLSIVLDANTFTDSGGFKSIEKYGLGYFNYMFALDKRVVDVYVIDIVRGHVYDNFNLYFVVLLLIIMVLLLTLSICAEELTNKLGFRGNSNSSHNKKVDGITYDHVQV